ncbi:Lcl C-terminal domain-containing protein [Roseiconus lacunae]|uniref:Lcl C-terminal domain-containing protein n=1 Tax=Roseiconus lacunae TaxID=2605694 RepID=UPI0011F0C6D6|nr:DUF1566 domain-containing protein [Roseiconus lacunae]
MNESNSSSLFTFRMQLSGRLLRLQQIPLVCCCLLSSITSIASAQSDEPNDVREQLESRKIADIREGLNSLVESPQQAVRYAATLLRRRHHPEFRRVLPKLVVHLPPEIRNDFNKANGAVTVEASPSRAMPIHRPPSPYTPSHLLAIREFAEKEQLTPKDREVLPQYLTDLEHAPENQQYSLIVWLGKIAPQDEQSIDAILRLGKTSSQPTIQFRATVLAFKLKQQAGLIARVRFVDRGGSIEDRETGLFWQADGTQSGLLNYYEGQDYAKNFTTGRLTDWRLPTGHELGTIFPADKLPFRNSRYSEDGVTRQSYWSSHLYGENYAGICDWQNDGGINNCFADRNRAFIRCVHDPLRPAE